MADTYVGTSYTPDELMTSNKENTRSTDIENLHNGTALGDGVITARHIASDAIKLGYSPITSNFSTTGVTSFVDVTNMSLTINVLAGRKIKLTVWAQCLRTTGGDGQGIRGAIFENTTQIAKTDITAGGANFSHGLFCMAVLAPTTGEHTYKFCIQQDVAGNTLTLIAASTSPAFILAEAI